VRAVGGGAGRRGGREGADETPVGPSAAAGRSGGESGGWGRFSRRLHARHRRRSAICQRDQWRKFGQNIDFFPKWGPRGAHTHLVVFVFLLGGGALVVPRLVGGLRSGVVLWRGGHSAGTGRSDGRPLVHGNGHIAIQHRTVCHICTIFPRVLAHGSADASMSFWWRLWASRRRSHANCSTFSSTAITTHFAKMTSEDVT
jgi:hypothetical protein